MSTSAVEKVGKRDGNARKAGKQIWDETSVVSAHVGMHTVKLRTNEAQIHVAINDDGIIREFIITIINSLILYRTTHKL